MLQRVSLGEASRFVQPQRPLLPGTVALFVKKGLVVVGCLIFVPDGKYVWTVHVRMVKGCPAGPAGCEAFKYMAKKLGAKKIAAYIPAHDRAAQHAAIQSGMTREGYSQKALWDGKIMNDIIYYGVNVCHPQ